MTQNIYEFTPEKYAQLRNEYFMDFDVWNATSFSMSQKNLNFNVGEVYLGEDGLMYQIEFFGVDVKQDCVIVMVGVFGEGHDPMITGKAYRMAWLETAVKVQI